MSDLIIEVENVSKLYHFGVLKHTTLKEASANWWSKVSGKSTPLPEKERSTYDFDASQLGPEPNSFWALKDISFSVQRGEALGIVGRNGAGKSTLLKILSRITEPTSGRAVIRGRVLSLLQVGTGFHPDLTGRENVYLNGAILGMRKKDIDKIFDNIVAFAEIEKFMDTSVKHYSSGMYMRLAFSVAAHLESEILILDEVLAVGDGDFRKKCLKKISDFSYQGRTVIFVSHQLSNVQNLCTRSLFLQKGILVTQGETADVIAQYAGTDISRCEQPLDQRTDRTGTGDIQYVNAVLVNEKGEAQSQFFIGQPFSLRLSYKNNTEKVLKDLNFSAGLYDFIGQKVSHLSSQIGPCSFDSIEPGVGSIELKITSLPLVPGRYRINLSILDAKVRCDLVQDVLQFEIQSLDYYKNGKPVPGGTKYGNLLSDYRFDKFSGSQ